ncbi:MAG: hypothetical protein CMB64_01310 [Euryarchaeota archaeon]|nr:hypothetical protein [Euryarchaeota archaeon]
MSQPPNSNYFITLDEAIELTNKTKIPLKEEKINLQDSFNRILSKDIYSLIDDPPFDNSSMDGYALIYSDTITASEKNPIELEIIDIISAGKTPIKKLTPGYASKIMTGAPIPDGADSIIMVEKTEKIDNKVRIFSPSFKNYIRIKGENITKKQLILKKGTKLTPRDLGLLATSGHSEIYVYKKLKISIISTGDELIIPGNKLSPGQIYESNGYVLENLIKKLGHNSNRVNIISDSIEKLRLELNKASLESDIIITTGGVSMGDFDIVRKIMELEGKILFWRMKIRPGSPPLFGDWKNTPIFGLPGNPASSFVVFSILIKPWLNYITNTKNQENKIIKAKLIEDIKIKKGFHSFLRVYVENNGNEMVAFTKTHQGSGNMNSLSISNALTFLKPNDKTNKNDIIDVILID